MEKCPYCGNDSLINDYFEEEWMIWCGDCGRDLTAEAMYEESLMWDEERNYENRESNPTSTGSKA